MDLHHAHEGLTIDINLGTFETNDKYAESIPTNGPQITNHGF